MAQMAKSERFTAGGISTPLCISFDNLNSTLVCVFLDFIRLVLCGVLLVLCAHPYVLGSFESAVYMLGFSIHGPAELLKHVP
jgi:hypothetical protein